jgi:ParB family chromosome partitioning protein
MSKGLDPKRRALGRGLESLLPTKSVVPAVQAVAEEPQGKPLEIELDKIERNPFQTRTTFDPDKLEELTASVRASGVVQPIVVRPLPDGRYQLIMGERRLMASYKAERKTIPAMVRNASDEQTMEMTIVENLQRADLNPIEQAKAFERLSNEFKMTQEQMSLRTGLSRTMVANFLRLLKLPEEVRGWVESGELSLGHAKVLMMLPSPREIASAAQKAKGLNWSVRATEKFVQGYLHPESKAPKDAAAEVKIDPNVREAEVQLQQKLGLRVKIEDTNGKGRVVIEYANLADFDALLTALGASVPD